jgi:hypothetical protein
MSWREGTSCCPNRLTVRAKVAEPYILTRLQAELLRPATLAYITAQVQTALAAQPCGGCDPGSLAKELAEEQRKRANLVAAIEESGEHLSVLLTALRGREANIRRLQGELARLEAAAMSICVDELAEWVAAARGSSRAVAGASRESES